MKLLFLHGLGGTGALWRPIAADLESEAEILAPDQRGHGGSRPVPTASEFTPIAFAQDVAALQEALHFKPAWLIGHSMGVRTASALAHLRPDLVQGLILVDLGFSGPAGGGLGSGLAGFLQTLPESFPSRAEARGFLKQHCPDVAIGQYLAAVAQTDATSGITTFPFDHAALIKTLEAAATNSVREWLQERAARGLPILALRGANSGVWNEAEFAQERKAFQAMPNVVFETFEGAGHGLPFEQRKQFTARIRSFIADHPSG